MLWLSGNWNDPAWYCDIHYLIDCIRPKGSDANDAGPKQLVKNTLNLGGRIFDSAWYYHAVDDEDAGEVADDVDEAHLGRAHLWPSMPLSCWWVRPRLCQHCLAQIPSWSLCGWYFPWWWWAWRSANHVVSNIMIRQVISRMAGKSPVVQWDRTCGCLVKTFILEFILIGGFSLSLPS